MLIIFTESATNDLHEKTILDRKRIWIPSKPIYKSSRAEVIAQKLMSAGLPCSRNNISNPWNEDNASGLSMQYDIKGPPPTYEKRECQRLAVFAAV